MARSRAISLGGLALAAGVHVERQRDPGFEVGGAGGIGVDDLVEGVEREPGGVGVLALGDRVPQPGAGVGGGLDADLAGEQSGLLGERGEPVAVVRYPLVDLRLVDERSTVGLGLDDDREMPGPRVGEDRERAVVGVVGF